MSDETPGTLETAALLTDLRDAVAGFAGRERKLVHDLVAKRNSADRQLREATEAAASQHRLQRTEAEAYFTDELNRNAARHEERAARIARAYPNAKRQQRARAEAHKGAGLSAAQMGRFRADRALEEGKAAAAEAHESALKLAAAEEGSLAAVRKGAMWLFFGYGAHLWKLRSSAPRESDGGDPGRTPPGEGGATTPAPAGGASPEDLVERAAAARREAAGHLGSYRRVFPASLFRFFPAPLLVLAGWGVYLWLAGEGSPLGQGQGQVPGWAPAVGGAAVFLVLILLHHLCRRAGGPHAAAAAESLGKARGLLDRAKAGAESRLVADTGSLEAEHAAACADLDRRWSEAVESEAVESEAGVQKVEEQIGRVRAKHEELSTKRRAFLESERPVTLEGIDAERDQTVESAEAVHARAVEAIDAGGATDWEALVAGWNERAGGLYRRVAAAQEQRGLAIPEWDPAALENWKAPADFAPAARFGSVSADVAAMAGELPEDARLALPGPASFELPLGFGIPGDGSLLLESDSAAAGPVAGALNALLVRLLASAPPGKIAFTVIDPVGLGENFAGVMHLADHEEALISGKIWTSGNHIEERLAELNERIEKIIQRYLRDEYATIADYNREAGAIAEKYHFLVVADFPTGFSETAVRRLQSIATSGARCGVHALVHRDRRQTMPLDAALTALRESGAVLEAVPAGGGMFKLGGAPDQGVVASLDRPPEHADAAAFYNRAGRAHVDADRVEVPFADIAPAPDALWSGDASAEVRVPIGRSGATKLQELVLGRDTKQHALVAGKTGSGKSTLFHVIVTNLALRYSPAEVEFYLVDFKKGVEFKTYATARLPHARVVAIESDREFGLSVLQKLDDELRRRGDLFRDAGVQDVAGYRRSPGAQPLPRTLLLIDEFQEYFVEDDRVAQGAAVLLDRIVRQGRAFGIHVVLGSQTLGGAYTLARATLGQMVVRIALQCNEADAYLIMDENNPAPRLLTRPGEGIYNDAAGAVESNSPFQVCWLPEEVRDRYLADVSGKSAGAGPPSEAPFVFEGNAPADVRDNGPLARALAGPPATPPSPAFAWLGAPNAIKGPTAAGFRRQSGNHLLVVGQREEAALAMVGVSMLGLAAQHPPGGARFYLLDSSAPESPERRFLEQVCAALPGPDRVTVLRNHDLGDPLAELAAEVGRRGDGDDGPGAAPPVYVFVSGLQHFKKLKQGDDYSFSLDADTGPDPSARFGEIVEGGSSVGVHVIATVDTYGNINRFVGRKALAEFEMRVVFQMAANDSASLIDSPAAGSLGLHRALFYHEGEGYLETFRPYALPDPSWIGEAGRQLAGRAAGNG